MSAVNRNLDSKIEKYLQYFPAVLITGVRQGGKTTLAKKIRPDWKYLDLEKSSDYERITRDFDFFFKENPECLIIDEAQESPELFRELRSIIDRHREKKNRFLLTGSSSFDLMHRVSESLPGRIGIVELGTLKFNEFYENPIPEFYNIFKNKINKGTAVYLKGLKNSTSYEKLINFFLKGGYPEPALAGDNEFFAAWMENYFQTYIQRDIRKLFPKLNIITYRRFINMLASLTGTIINRSDLGRSLDTSEVTIKEYLDIAHGSFLWRNIHSFQKSRIKSIIKMPKGIFRDSGLAHYLQNIRTAEDLKNYPRVGASFESFIIEELIKGLDAVMTTGWDFYYYRTKHGAEIDLILEGDFGILPVEIKYGIKIREESIRSLKKFISDNDLPLGIIINNSENVELISKKIIQVPAGMV